MQLPDPLVQLPDPLIQVETKQLFKLMLTISQGKNTAVTKSQLSIGPEISA